MNAPDPIGLRLRTPQTIRENMELVQYAEQKGFLEAWQNEYRLSRDAVTPAAAYAAVTDEIKICLGVINNWTRNAALIAQTASTLAELTGPDRVICGIGAWWEPIASSVGVDRRNPLRAMRETVEAVNQLIELEEVTYDGEFVNLDSVEIGAPHAPRATETTDVYVGATGEKMLELTGHFADGCIMNHMVTPEYNEWALSAMERGAKRGGRSLDDISRSQMIYCSMDPDQDVAIARSQRFLAQYVGQHPDIAKSRRSMDNELIDDVAETVGEWPADEENITEAMSLIPEDVVRTVTATGSPEQCRNKIREYHESGVDVPVVSPLGNDHRFVIDEFARGYR
jgi:alkanesulfonate monooxygenase SsuD/methylene tetrahydromethanopterin reductase-like flavin-dependent oxidoreductase (luciferase family)